jgi:hypothetical protein
MLKATRYRATTAIGTAPIISWPGGAGLGWFEAALLVICVDMRTLLWLNDRLEVDPPDLRQSMKDCPFK